MNYRYPNASPQPVQLPAMPTAQSLNFGASIGPAAPSPSNGGWSMPSLPTTAGQASAGLSGGTLATQGTGGDVPADVGGGFWKSTFMTKDGGLDLGAVGDVAQTIGALGNVWSGIQANKIARDTLSFQKKAYSTNLANSLASYNLALEDRMKARYAQNNRPEDAQAYIDKHKLGS